MAVYELICLIIFLTAVFAYVNHQFIKWPPTIGIMALSLICSVSLLTFRHVVPELFTKVTGIVASINFGEILMKIMLGFLLFAGAIHVDYRQLKKEMLTVLVLSTIGTFIATFLVSLVTFFLFRIFGGDIPYIYCLLFGALISPTDPIAVIGILKQAGIPASLELKIVGESLFNDGVAVVIFMTIFEIASNGTKSFSIADTGILFLREAIGGLVFGFVAGYAGYLILKTIDDYRVEVLITLTLVMCGYASADFLHVSAPLAIIVIGIFMGSSKVKQTLSANTRDYLAKFWDLVDEIFNAILFLLIGFEMLLVKANMTLVIISIIMVIAILLSRWVSVGLPVLLLKYHVKFEKNIISILTWGGLRGGLSIAMALSLPERMHRDEFLLITYVVVIFSILVQGLSIGNVVKRLQTRD